MDAKDTTRIRPRLRLEVPPPDNDPKRMLPRTPSWSKKYNSQSVSLGSKIFQHEKKVVQRSISGPMEEHTKKELTRLYSGTYLVKPVTPRPKQGDDHDELSSEEDLSCRICLCDLTQETSSTLRLECSCKGGLALAHQDCALKWFGIRGNRQCDVCGQEVVNLPVTLRLENATQSLNQQLDHQGLSFSMLEWRLWISIIASVTYFCFLEQMLIKQNGNQALILALPFGLLFGITTSITGTVFVEQKFIWLLSATQIGLVISLAHLFYQMVESLTIFMKFMFCFCSYISRHCFR
ncbi:uncharacterized protein LOC112341040 isoform X1 [Selaginella moellendorffii]|uniref:uncharacterized protein LOC112341040 isoform X1 n=2 Tax=Selaginella moellendorffii TaxID=88036 RepID=UPI000D1C4273|nr:uncharacterized protein LOC112341040 isoform X1 [Selaginella moellendorffii]|eukprot:XP_024516189.1 uncharacterized protein LOC112341040 isoform X1 [Selaginella moellendorffii]